MNGKEKEEGRSWQQVMTNLELSKKYQEKDAAGYSGYIRKSRESISKESTVYGKNLMLKGEDEAASKITGK